MVVLEIIGALVIATLLYRGILWTLERNAKRSKK